MENGIRDEAAWDMGVSEVVCDCGSRFILFSLIYHDIGMI